MVSLLTIHLPIHLCVNHIFSKTQPWRLRHLVKGEGHGGGVVVGAHVLIPRVGAFARRCKDANYSGFWKEFAYSHWYLAELQRRCSKILEEHSVKSLSLGT